MNFSKDYDRIRARIKPVVCKFAPLFRRLGFDYEDVEQEALIVALECQPKYLYKTLNWRLFDLLRHYHSQIRNKTKVLSNYLLYDEETEQFEDGILYVIDPSYERQEEERDAREEIDHYLARSGMSSRDRAIVRRYAQGATLKAAGAEFGVSKKTASIIVTRFQTISRHANKFKIPKYPTPKQRTRAFYFTDPLKPCKSFLEVQERQMLYNSHIWEVETAVEFGEFDGFGAHCFAARVACATPNQRKRLCKLIEQAEKIAPFAFSPAVFNYWEREGAQLRDKTKSPLEEARDKYIFSKLKDVMRTSGAFGVSVSRVVYWGRWFECNRHNAIRRDRRLLQQIAPAIETLRAIPPPLLPRSDPVERIVSVYDPALRYIDLTAPHYGEFVTNAKRYATVCAPVLGMLDALAHDLTVTDARGLEKFDSPAYCAAEFRKELPGAFFWLPRVLTDCVNFNDS